MPPRKKITSDMILAQAFKIAEEQGIMAVTSRSVAKSLGCSIQPIFSQFPTMEELRQATFDFACKQFAAEILEFEHKPNFFPLTTKWVVHLAKNKPNLFRLLYLSEGFKGNDYLAILMNYESNHKIISKMTELYRLDESKCKEVLQRISLFLVGICTMICVNHIEFTDQQVAEMMKQTVSDMIIGAGGIMP